MAGLVFFVLMLLFIYILLSFSLYISFFMSFFVLASKRNNHTDSEMDTLIVFILSPWSPVINSDVHAVRTRYLA